MEPDRIQKLRVAAVSTILAGTLVLSASVLALTAGSALAQETTGVLGSPSATTTIDGKQLPPPPGKFGGVMKESVQDSKPYWQPQVVPPKGAPNILLILTDDQGFGVPSTFGGVIPTPALDRIANAGLRYTQFHTTSLCSPTRAALITGRNHHSVGFGVITGCPQVTRATIPSSVRRTPRLARRTTPGVPPEPCANLFKRLHQNLACKVSPRSLRYTKISFG